MKGKLLVKYQKDSHVGKGTVFADIAQESLKTRLRVKCANEFEDERLKRINKTIEREQRVKDSIHRRIMGRVEKNLEELRGFRAVLQSDYKVDNFKTLQPGFQRRWVNSPRTARRLALETRIYHAGYNRNYFQPEIKRKLRQVDPGIVQKVMNKVLKEQCIEESGEVIDRRLSDVAFYKTLKDKQEKGQFTFKPNINALAPIPRQKPPGYSSMTQKLY